MNDEMYLAPCADAPVLVCDGDCERLHQVSRKVLNRLPKSGVTCGRQGSRSFGDAGAKRSVDNKQIYTI
jgi:hypothetical protein